MMKRNKNPNQGDGVSWGWWGILLASMSGLALLLYAIRRIYESNGTESGELLKQEWILSILLNRERIARVSTYKKNGDYIRSSDEVSEEAFIQAALASKLQFDVEIFLYKSDGDTAMAAQKERLIRYLRRLLDGRGVNVVISTYVYDNDYMEI